MRLIETGTLYANPDPLLVSRQAMFPGLARLPDGEIVAIFSIGQAFDAADTRAYTSRSSDDGKSWSAPVRLHDAVFAPELSESLKPALLVDGTLLATGYAFERPGPLVPIVDPVTGALLPLINLVARSQDGGLSWSLPERFSVDGAALELSGPVIERANGEIIGAAAPFHLGATGQEGWLIASRDGGASWHKKAVFFRAPAADIAAWESRVIDFGGDRIGVLFWAHEVASGRNLSNRLALSEDGGASFTTIDTGIAAQASGGMALGPDEMLSIHAHRDAPVSLTAYRSRLINGRLELEDRLDLFTVTGSGTEDGSLFSDLRFGQPSLLRLDASTVLGCCWRVEGGQHVIKTFRIQL